MIPIICIADKNGLGYEILRSFSLTDNYNDLIEVSDREAPFLYYMKIVYTIFVVGGHRLLYFMYFPKFNPEAIETVSNYDKEDLKITAVDCHVSPLTKSYDEL